MFDGAAGQVEDGVALDGETLGFGGAEVVVAGAAESLSASPDANGAGGGVVLVGVGGGGGCGVVGGGVGVLAALLVGAGAAGVVGSGAAEDVAGAAEEVAGPPVPVAEPLGSWLPAGALLPGAEVDVVAGELPPGAGALDEGLPGDVVPGVVVP